MLYARVDRAALEVVYTSSFDRLERDNASNKRSRISRYIEAARADVDPLVPLGLAVFPDDADGVYKLLSKADSAMY